MVTVTSVFRIDRSNLGDLASAPHNYFDWISGPTIDIFDDPSRHREVLQRSDLVVIGGGGMLGYCDAEIAALLEVSRRSHGRSPRLVWWGAGNGNRRSVPDYLADFDLVGLRDHHLSGDFEWIPCASSLHPAFDAVEVTSKQDVTVKYDAHRIPVEGVLKTELGLRSMSNDARVNGMSTVIGFLASASRVVTRSYHGAYWASLLGLDVFVPAQPAPLKYVGLKYPPTYITTAAEIARTSDIAAQARLAAHRRDEARNRNYRFARRVRELIDG